MRLGLRLCFCALEGDISMDEHANKQKEMNIVGHLTELRNRIFVTMIAFILFFITSLIFVQEIYAFFDSHIEVELNITGLPDILWIYLTIASIVALVGTLPVLSIQLWLFVRPGLTDTERKFSLLYIPVVFILFVGGLVVGYILFIQLIMPFLLSLNKGMFNEIFTVDKYWRFLMQIVVPFGFIFEIPIVLMFLTSLEIITPQFLRKMRKYAYFILLVFGGLVTPPDVLLMITVAIPLFLLYEFSIYLCVIVYRKKQKRKAAIYHEETND